MPPPPCAESGALRAVVRTSSCSAAPDRSASQHGPSRAVDPPRWESPPHPHPPAPGWAASLSSSAVAARAPTRAPERRRAARPGQTTPGCRIRRRPSRLYRGEGALRVGADPAPMTGRSRWDGSRPRATRSRRRRDRGVGASRCRGRGMDRRDRHPGVPRSCFATAGAGNRSPSCRAIWGSAPPGAARQWPLRARRAVLVLDRALRRYGCSGLLMGGEDPPVPGEGASASCRRIGVRRVR